VEHYFNEQMSVDDRSIVKETDRSKAKYMHKHKWADIVHLTDWNI
jgi:hypothetical protein